MSPVGIGSTAAFTSLLLFIKCIAEVTGFIDSQPVIFTDQWAVHVTGGDLVADEIAAKHGFTNLGKIFADYYHFQHRNVAKRSRRSNIDHHSLLTREPKVRWAEQQVIKSRVKRIQKSVREHQFSESNHQTVQSDSRPIRSVNFNLNDPGWIHMWYLNRGNGRDMNVQEAWAEGITGKGSVVSILDDGLEKDHPDIIKNYDPMASYDVIDADENPSPRYDATDSNRHGTRCAGEVAAQGNNSICAVGVAFDASIGGVRMLDGDVTDAVEARSLSYNSQHIDIYSASWGPDDDGKTVDGPGELATRAFIDGVVNGRGGKGSIFVWASGNGGREHDNCNCDGYTNSIWTLTVSSATENGSMPWYSEACSSTLATAYSSGALGEKQIVTTDLHHSCTPSHTGTSAAAPLAAGICALALEANRNLTWRDMQHIVVRTARPDGLKAHDWQTNGVGRNVSHSFGYGLMDAGAMVRLARVWKSVAPQQFCRIPASDTNKVVPPKSTIKLQVFVRECTTLNVMEHLQALISLTAMNRGDIQIHLTSPTGTRSTLLARRPLDNSHNGFHSWPFMSVHFWGESPFGVWSLEIDNEGRFPASLAKWTLIIYGTKEHPEQNIPSGLPPAETNFKLSNKGQVQMPFAEKLQNKILPSPVNVEKNREAEFSVETIDQFPEALSLKDTSRNLTCGSGSYLWMDKCVNTCPNASHPVNYTKFDSLSGGVCAPCHYSCHQCNGPSDSECTACYSDSQLKIVKASGFNSVSESHCYPHELVKQLGEYERWSLGVELALALNVALVTGLLAYLMCSRKSCTLYTLCCGRRRNVGNENVRHGDYSLLRTTQSNRTTDQQPPILETINPS